MQPRETKLADTVASCVEDHFFNPAAVARHLSNQPIYTVDKVMELVSYIITSMKGRYDVEQEQGSTSDGLILANNLYKAIQIVDKKVGFENIKIPKPPKYKAKTLENTHHSSRYSWLHETNHGPQFHTNVQSNVIN